MGISGPLHGILGILLPSFPSKLINSINPSPTGDSPNLCPPPSPKLVCTGFPRLGLQVFRSIFSFPGAFGPNPSPVSGQPRPQCLSEPQILREKPKIHKPRLELTENSGWGGRGGAKHGRVLGQKGAKSGFFGFEADFFFLSSFNFFGGFGPSLSWSMRNSAITKQRRLGELIFNPFVLIFLLVLSQNHNFLGLFEGVFLGGFLKIASFWGEAKGGRRGGGERPCTPKNRSFSPHSKRWRNYLICK